MAGLFSLVSRSFSDSLHPIQEISFCIIVLPAKRAAKV